MANPEGQFESHLVPPLDPTLLTFTEEETAFLHHVISSDDNEIRERILDVQKRCYEKHPYPCILAFHFVKLMMADSAVYPAVVAAGKTGDNLLLDLGCCMGTDVRKLVHDGYPASHVLGCDLRREFIDSGYALFGDKDTCPIRFFTSNVFDLPTTNPAAGSDTTSPPDVDVSSVTDLSELRGALTHIYTGALFHLFDEDNHYGLALRLALLLKRVPGATIFGLHQGLEKEGYIEDRLDRNRYGHSERSWPVLWKKVFSQIEGEAFAEQVVVQAKLTEGYTSRILIKTRGQGSVLYWSVQIV